MTPASAGGAAPEAGPAWDRPVPHEGPPTLAYLVCAVPRSGSTMLAEGLRRTGLLGAPTEYLNRPVVAGPLRGRWGCATWEEYLRALVRHRSTDGGAFGLKAHWNDLVDLTVDVAGVADPGPHDVRRVVEGLLPGLRYVRIRRLDRRRAAVSWWMARHTGEWRRDPGQAAVPDRPPYDRALLEAAAAQLAALDAGWDRYFAAAGVAPVEVTYEGLVADHAGTVAAVAGALGVDADPAGVPPPATARQADAVTEAVLARWAEEAPEDANGHEARRQR